MNRRPRREFNAYHRKYGSTRSIRADRMYRNIAPEGMSLPPVSNVQIEYAGQPSVATFVNSSRYMEQLFNGRTLKPELNRRAYLIVRSQKYVFPSNQMYYFLLFPGRLKLQGIVANGRRYLIDVVRNSTCTCRDFMQNGRIIRPATFQCKHKLLAVYSIRGTSIDIR